MSNVPNPLALCVPMNAPSRESLCAFCRGTSSTSGVGAVDVTLRWMGSVASIDLCVPCYDLFRAHMKAVAVEVARSSITEVASGWRNVLARWCLRLAWWLVSPTRRTSF